MIIIQTFHQKIFIFIPSLQNHFGQNIRTEKEPNTEHFLIPTQLLIFLYQNQIFWSRPNLKKIILREANFPYFLISSVDIQMKRKGSFKILTIAEQFS